MIYLGKYNQAKTILFPLVTKGSTSFTTGATFAAGDVKIIKDEGAAANTTNLPAHEGNGIYSLVLTATEMSAARIGITIIDQTSPKVWEDQAVLLETYGDASAEHAFDLDTATVNPGAGGIVAASFGAGAIDAAAIAAGAIDAATFAADVDTYQAKVWLVDDDANSTDRYVAVWFKNSQPIVAGITSPTIQVFDAAGTDLIASTAMTQIAATGTYNYDAVTTERAADGEVYIAKVTATIGGASRTWYQPVSRDST